jgi:hypothetical protein
VETCCGVEPHRSAFAARFAPGAARRGAGGGNRTHVTGLEDQGLTIRPQPRESRIPESNRNRTDTNGEHDRRADAAMRWSHWVTLPDVLRAKQNSSLLRLTPRAGLQGIAPRSGVLEAPLRLSLRPKTVALLTGVEPVSPLRQRGCDTSRIKQQFVGEAAPPRPALRGALVANRTRRLGLGDRAPIPSARAIG